MKKFVICLSLLLGLSMPFTLSADSVNTDSKSAEVSVEPLQQDSDMEYVCSTTVWYWNGFKWWDIDGSIFKRKGSSRGGYYVKFSHGGWVREPVLNNPDYDKNASSLNKRLSSKYMCSSDHQPGTFYFSF